MGNPDLIGSAETCSILGDIDRGTLIRWIAAGKISYLTKLPGETGAYVFDRAEVERVKRAQDQALAS